MPDFEESIEKHADLSEKKQKQAGKAIAGDMAKPHKDFLKTVIDLLDRGVLDTKNPQSLLNTAVYEAMPQEWKDKTDAALVNIVDQLVQIETFYRAAETPNSSPHLETMIEHLWQMKERIEKEYDVFVF